MSEPEKYFVDIKGNGCPVFVVEYSAYEALRAERDEANEKLGIMTGAYSGLLNEFTIVCEAKGKYEAEVERSLAQMNENMKGWVEAKSEAESLRLLADNYRAKLARIEMCCGYDPEHTGDDVQLLKEIIEALREEARDALEEK